MPKNGYVQWGWPDLEELLQCPVCLDVPVPGIVEQCRHGHHICANCKKQVENCPLCKCDFHGTRNFVVEELIRHFDVLKNTMLLNSLVTEEVKKKKQKKKNKKLNASAPVFTPQITRPRKVNTPSATKGQYPCRVMDCGISLPSGRLLNHVRAHHSCFLTEGVVDFTDNYTQTWEIPFENKLPLNAYTFVVFVRGIGLIFLNMEIIKPGHLITVIQMVLKTRKSENFLARIDFFNDDYNISTTYTYNTRLSSVRNNMQSMMEKNWCYTLTASQMKQISMNKTFKCKLRLSPFNAMEGNALTRPNSEFVNILRIVRASFIQRLQQQQEEMQNNKLVDESAAGSSVNCEKKLQRKYKNKKKDALAGILNISNSISNVNNVHGVINTCPQPREIQNGPVPPPNVEPRSRNSRRRRRNRASTTVPIEF